MKALLTIDMPDRCYDCPLFRLADEESDRLDGTCIISRVHRQHGYDKPSYCPLRRVEALKAAGRDYVLYERQYLYEHLDREFELLKSAKEFEEKQNESSISD